MPRHRDFAHLLQNREDFAHLPTQFVITFPVPLPGSPRQQTPSSKADCPTRNRRIRTATQARGRRALRREESIALRHRLGSRLSRIAIGLRQCGERRCPTAVPLFGASASPATREGPRYPYQVPAGGLRAFTAARARFRAFDTAQTFRDVNIISRICSENG